MCAWVGLAMMAAGMVQNKQGERKQKFEYTRANKANDFWEAEKRKILENGLKRNAELSQQKNDAIVREAEELTPNRLDKIIASENRIADSNVKALRDANAIGADSVTQLSYGNQSDTYIEERAKAAARQSEQAVKLARLFASQAAINDTLAIQRERSLDPRLEQGLVDARRNTLQRGIDLLFDNIGYRQSKDTRIDPTKGATNMAIGNALFQAGASRFGQGAGSYFGKQQANANIKNNLL